VLIVERPILQLGGKLSESTPKTRAGERLIFLDAETAELLRHHHRAQVKLRMQSPPGTWQDNDLIFCQPTARRGTPTT
jgi:hypothetical protein